MSKLNGILGSEYYLVVVLGERLFKPLLSVQIGLQAGLERLEKPLSK